MDESQFVVSEGNIDLIISEFAKNREQWANVGLQAAYRYEDLTIRNLDRQFNLVLGLTTISAAFLTIVAPLIKHPFSHSLIFATYSFVTVAALGVIILIITIQRDKRLIAEDRAWEHQIYGAYLDQCVAIYSKAYDYREKPDAELLLKLNIDVINYFAMQKKTNQDAEDRQTTRSGEFSARALRRLENLFWLLLCTAALFLFVWLTAQIIA
jgi:ABC-type Fe3+ transport system permease subunit